MSQLMYFHGKANMTENDPIGWQKTLQLLFNNCTKIHLQSVETMTDKKTKIIPHVPV